MHEPSARWRWRSRASVLPGSWRAVGPLQLDATVDLRHAGWFPSAPAGPAPAAYSRHVGSREAPVRRPRPDRVGDPRRGAGAGGCGLELPPGMARSRGRNPPRGHRDGRARVRSHQDRPGPCLGGEHRRWEEDYGVILDRIEGALGRVDEYRGSYPIKRGEGALPLVALPVVGIGFGGYSADRGQVLRFWSSASPSPPGA